MSVPTPAVLDRVIDGRYRVEAEIARVRRRYDDETAERAEAALRHFAGVLLHIPSVRARELAQSGRRDEFLDGLEAVFGIDRPA